MLPECPSDNSNLQHVGKAREVFSMDNRELLDLAKRCEASREKDVVELLEDAFVLCFPKPARIWVTDNTGDWTPEYAARHELSWRFNDFIEARAFLDAAMTLVPEGLTMMLQTRFNGFHAEVGWPHAGNAATPALALCAAALRARAIAIAMEAFGQDREDGLDAEHDSAGGQASPAPQPGDQ